MVQQTGLASQGLATLAHTDHIERVRAVARWLHHCGIGRHAKEVADVPPDSLRCLQVIELNLNSNVSRDYVEPSGKTKNRGQLGQPVARVFRSHPDKLVFDRDREGMHAVQYLFAPEIPVLQSDLDVRALAQFPN